MTSTQVFYLKLQAILITDPSDQLIITPIKERVDAVRIGNFCRNCGYRVDVGGIGNVTHWVIVHKEHPRTKVLVK